tara:strand:+ start:226 stop:693 length:468 start_codon:yes stop_codon:yes gene_type:complete
MFRFGSIIAAFEARNVVKSGLPPIFRWADFVLPSTLNLSPLLEILIEPALCYENIAEVQLGLHEVLVNAVQHGNECDPSKLLRVRRIMTPNWLIWQVQDEGNGLPEDERIGVLPSGLEADTGRGLFIMYECFDDVRWSSRGNRVQVACRRKNTNF